MAISGSSDDVEYGVSLLWGLNTVDSSSEYVNPRTTIHRTTGTVAAATSAWSTVVTTRNGITRYDDILPADGKRRWYRIRHEYAGMSPSTWLGTVDAKPVELYEV